MSVYIDGIAMEPCMAEIINALESRGHGPDETHEVSQGKLEVWYVANQHAARLMIDGGMMLLGQYLYINTTPPQAVADHIVKSCGGLHPTDSAIIDAACQARVRGERL